MKTTIIIVVSLVVVALGCGSSTKNKSDMSKTEFKQGTFGYDYHFLQKHQKDLVLLKDSATNAMILLSPAYQGRVMTSSVNGMESHSNGWINFKLIELGKTTEHINAYGGEERFWLGPEGGQFSIYFAPGSKQEFANWHVPAILDTLPFQLDRFTSVSARFSADLNLTNYSGTVFQAKMERTVKLLQIQEIEKIIGRKIPDSLYTVAYQSENTIINRGTNEWTTHTGMLSIWMLSMLNPSPDVVVFIPFREGDAKEIGKIVSDDYFGKVPADRLKVGKGMIYLKADGKYRSKIGISPQRVSSWAASYDANRNALTLLHCNFPEGRTDYVNSKWEIQKDPFSGDAINAYNDGPVEDGTQMGPFYELESSSPAASLKPGEKLNHIQTIVHIEGSEAQLNSIIQSIFSISTNDLKTALN